jgi:hypothetical protein
MSSLTPQQFANNWQNTTLGERQSYQSHFIELCRLVGHETPSGSGLDSRGNRFSFEYGIKKDGGGQGFADVFYEGHFAIEYKAAGKYKDLTEAYQQLLKYRENLNNPPLLVVTDIENWQIHTNWPNTEKRVYEFKNIDIARRTTVQNWLRFLFDDPERLNPRRNTAQVTTDAAKSFHTIAEDMRREWEADPARIAHFLTKLVFCLFAEDVGLLPPGPKGDSGIFAEIVEQTRREPARFTRYAHELFQAMAEGGEVLFKRIPYFNGSLFDNVEVAPLTPEALGELSTAANLNWESVEPAIFGTLFERSLDPSKRAQLGAHYTSREDILLIVEPVLMQPLRREWAALREEAVKARALFDAAKTPKERLAQEKTLYGLREQMLKRLREIKVLDPACGSGNFLYVSLQLLMDMEKAVINDEVFAGLQTPFPEVHPRQMYGIEKNEIAHDLASIVVWIGYIQWRQNNGYITLTQREPILEALKDNIRQMDAIMNEDGTEPEWPTVDVIVGNPPFLGNQRLRRELGDEYLENLWKLYENRVPAFADLVCYWFEKARAQIAAGKAKRAGLLATNSIRGGANREVLKRIKASGDIFMAWSDRNWVLDGADVRVSMVGFDKGDEKTRVVDGLPVATINPDLTSDVDITVAKPLVENRHICFKSDEKGGAFDIPFETAQKMLSAVNQSGRSNTDVVHPWVNGLDLVRNPRNMWIIDFGVDMPLQEAMLYELPFEYIEKNVHPVREKNRRDNYRIYWWIHIEPRPGMRQALKPIKRYICSPRVSKHRIFVWLPTTTISDSGTVAIAREDDYFFGVLHSKLHEVWALRMGTSLEDRPRYTPTTTFETFPFPWPPGKEDYSSPAYQAISEAAKCLNEERTAWLKGETPHPLTPSASATRGEGEKEKADAQKHIPAGEGEKESEQRVSTAKGSGISEREMKERTLTNLYNALNVWRGKEKMRVKAAAGDFAPRLDELHNDLDKAVCDAYGWPHTILGDEEEILRRLLALNLKRASTSPPSPLSIHGEGGQEGEEGEEA